MNFDVYVGEQWVGSLGPAAGGAYVFAYNADIPAEYFVSLTMPVRLESYSWSRGLPPFFLMNLPEGFQKDVLRAKLGPHADVSDAGLLALTGARTIGRVRVLPKAQPLARAGETLALASVLASPDSRSMLIAYLQTGIAEGISGVMPKTFAVKTTVTTDDYLLKTALARLPGFAINEYLCLEVARRAGLLVPTTSLAQDGEVLAVRRFDRIEAGVWRGVEDFCALKGLDPVNKYSGSLEEICKLLTVYAPAHTVSDSARRLFTLFLLNYALRNADAHLKNYALTYTSRSDVALAPVYDILTVTVYPDYVPGAPALTLGGRKVWHAGKALHELGATRLSLTDSQMSAAVEAVSQAISEVAPEVKRYAMEFAEFREVGKHMLSVWETGRLDILPTARTPTRKVKELAAAVGLSDEKVLPKKKKKRRSREPTPDGGI